MGDNSPKNKNKKKKQAAAKKPVATSTAVAAATKTEEKKCPFGQRPNKHGCHQTRRRYGGSKCPECPFDNSVVR
ncbi:MAG: hypothetical protein CMI53_00690 [Parcubacteria group bacterium]|nr:hypothetical protein [Parcubacteria group bacterium]|tara:strand:- start:6174 stop:6395 length:222 start_codon:yes stop_codon:yes gene_type:complete